MADNNRKDPKGRNLRVGETYDAVTGRYRYSYNDFDGNRRQIYSWTLTKNDIVPSGRHQKRGESLREKEARVQAEIINGVDGQGSNMSVLQLLKRYADIKNPDVRETTRKGYKTQLKFMATNRLALTMSRKRLREVDAMSAEKWLKDLHTQEGRSYSSLHTLKGMLRQAFIYAKKSRWVVDNPFDFGMTKKAYGGTKTRDAISRADMRRFLDFVQSDSHFSRYYDGIYILFNTGLRISEFCGLTPGDIDYDKHVIHVRRQLLRVWDGTENRYYLELPKTDNGIRDVPMLHDVELAFKHAISHRKKVKDVVVWDELHQMAAQGFIWLDKDNHYEVSQHWSNHLRWARNKFNSIFKDELPPITPHVCRHTFCSNCAGAGMSPKTLQMIMGHSSIEFTLNVYTHLDAGDVTASFRSFIKSGAYDICRYNRPVKVKTPVSGNADKTWTEGEVDPSEPPDDCD